MVTTQRLKQLYLKLESHPWKKNVFWTKQNVLYFVQLLIEESENDDEERRKRLRYNHED